jgi:hypothetical protein
MSSKRSALSADIESVPTPSKKNQSSLDDNTADIAIKNKRKVDMSGLSNQIEVKPPKSPKKGVMNKSFDSHPIINEDVDVTEVPRNISTSSSTSKAPLYNTVESGVLLTVSPKKGTKVPIAVAEG